MSNVKKTLQMTSLLFGLAILFSYIGWHLGYDGLILVGEVNLSWQVMYLINKALLAINFVFYGGFILQELSMKAVYYMIPALILSIICDLVGVVLLGTGPIPTIYFIFVALFLLKKKGKPTIIRSFIAVTVSILYQIVAVIFKTGELTLNYAIPQFTRLMFSIDMILILLLLFLVGGVKDGWWLERLVFTGRRRDERSCNDCNQDDEEDPSNVPVDKFERWVMRSVIGAVQVLQWLIILWVCSLDNLFLDALIITTSFICHGKIISTRKHLKPIILCTLAATAMFYFSARFTISFRYSQFFPIIIGLALVYTLYRVSCQFDEAAKKNTIKQIERLELLEYQMEEAWECLEDIYTD